MVVRRAARFVVAAMALLLPLLAAQLVAAPHAAAVPKPAAARIVYYDASGAAEFRAAVDEGAKAWNAAVHNVQLQPGGPGQAQVTVLADDGWPRTESADLGTGTVYMGREAVKEGFYPPRIAAHELGHILGLPDNRNGRCDYLMSGHSSPTSCRETRPHQTEAQQVEQTFANAGSARAVRSAAFDTCFRPAAAGAARAG
jgi:snapalysin